ncbi:MAG: hypothetical protein H0X69_15225 [Gemmatimonadales bacterium]|nr:hypothetical protein [Gemmatimonadales bacterium]
MAVVLTGAMLLFPPFISVNGTEHAFVATGPEWMHRMGARGEDFGLTARIHWAALLVQVAAVWAIALGARWFLGRDAPAAKVSASLLLLLIVPSVGLDQGATSVPLATLQPHTVHAAGLMVSVYDIYPRVQAIRLS